MSGAGRCAFTFSNSSGIRTVVEQYKKNQGPNAYDDGQTQEARYTNARDSEAFADAVKSGAAKITSHDEFVCFKAAVKDLEASVYSKDNLKLSWREWADLIYIPMDYSPDVSVNEYDYMSEDAKQAKINEDRSEINNALKTAEGRLSNSSAVDGW